MKKSLLYLSLIGACMSLNSCLDFDNPGDELSSNQTVSEVTETTETSGVVGNRRINSIDYQREISMDKLEAAYNKLYGNSLLSYSLSAQWALRGGKESSAPAEHAYQYDFSLGPDNYAGYFVVPHYDFPYSNASLPTTYSISETFNSGPHGIYTITKNTILELLTAQDLNNMPEIKAINLLFYCIAAQEKADLSGPFTYIEDKAKSQNPSIYNTMEVIYDSIASDLDLVVKVLKYAKENRSAEYNSFLWENIVSNYKTFMVGCVKEQNFLEFYWRVANSIKLRMAMHMAKVKPAEAKKWAEEAVASGVIESRDMQAVVTGQNKHPLIQISDWGDTRLNANFESILASLNHPYYNYLWEKNSGAIINSHYSSNTDSHNNTYHSGATKALEAGTKVVGIRPGTFVGEGQSATNPYTLASTFNRDVMMNAPLYLVKWAEVDFLRAEGALRGWNMGGTMEEFYERGIRNGYCDETNKNFGNSVLDSYVSQTKSQVQQRGYIQQDPFGDGDDWPSVTTIGVDMKGITDKEELLEMIITQKYIALFPFSWEAWVDLRRTGYPKMFPVMYPESGDGSLSDGDIIRRIPWLPTDPQGKAAVAATGLSALGGADTQATRLWWDIEGSNF